MKRLFLLTLALWFPSLSAASPEAETLLAKARARLGQEAVLDGVTSIHFFGSIEMADTAAPSGSGKAGIEIVFQKPTQHRMVVTTEKGVDITGLDDYFAWRRVVPAGEGKIQNRPMDKDQTKRLRANTWENLFFYRGIEQRGGALVDKGEVEKDGVMCRKIVFDYGSGIEFVRYFDVATGRLVLTETQPVGTIREEGEMIVAGIRFPQRLIATGVSAGDGKSRVITITFDRIAVNETFPASTFEQPIGLGK